MRVKILGTGSTYSKSNCASLIVEDGYEFKLEDPVC